MAMGTTEDTIPTATDTGEGRRGTLIPLNLGPILTLTLTPGIATMAVIMVMAITMDMAMDTDMAMVTTAHTTLTHTDTGEGSRGWLPDKISIFLLRQTASIARQIHSFFPDRTLSVSRQDTICYRQDTICFQ